LSTRYEKGKQTVAKFMAKQHRFVTHQPITLAHGEVVEKQAALGPTTLLVKKNSGHDKQRFLYLRKRLG